MELTLYDTSGGDLSLNFLNTSDWPLSSAPSESLNTYADLLTWAFEGEVITEEEKTRLSARAAAEPREAGEMLAIALQGRAALYRILKDKGSARDLELFNRLLGRALAHRRIELSPARWAVNCDPLPLDYPLWPVMLAAADLLTSPDLERVHTCANHECGWIFLDRSRNGSRKWCSSSACGNRERVRQYYSRKR